MIFSVSQFQNIFDEVFEGCDTSRFALESEIVRVKISHSKIINVVTSAFSDDIKRKIRGKIKLQVVVGLDDESCLLSIENKSNTKFNVLDLKNIIDENLIWEIPEERVSPIIRINFKKKKIIVNRLGFNGNIGWHTLKE